MSKYPSLSTKTFYAVKHISPHLFARQIKIDDLKKLHGKFYMLKYSNQFTN